MRTGYVVLLMCWATFTWGQSPSAIPTNGLDTDSVAKTLDIFRTMGKSNDAIAQALKDRQRRRAIVFVPGILGSKLTAADGKVIFGDLSDYRTIISRLELPSSLIDENAESGVSAELLLKLGPMDLYGNAMAPMQAWAAAHGIQFVTCGYDWRRDIRAGARDLDRCLQHELQNGPRDVVMIAHSMGGLVTWTWMMQHEAGQYSPSINVISTAVLGSPLEGSCEIVRMIQSGYIQPKRNDKIVLQANLKPLKSLLDKWVDALTNVLSGQLTQGIRPLVLSWPGALELSPPPSAAYGKTSCVGVPASNTAPIGTPGTSYYSPAFWKTIAGEDMLRKGNTETSYDLPASLPMVLSKATEFRNSFKVAKLRSPVWLYYSQIWLVPSEAGYRDPHISSADQWATVWGDGRVPASSAQVIDNPTVFSFAMGLESVHGNLPADPNFFEDFFNGRLSKVFSTSLATGMMKEALTRSDWLTAYARISNITPESEQLHENMEPNAANGNETVAYKDALAIATNFKDRICSLRGDCAQSYSKAKLLAGGVSVSTLAKLALFGSAAQTVAQNHPDYAYAEGNKGLTLAKSMSWSAASNSLSKADQAIQNILGGGAEAPTKVDPKFANVVAANLGKSLYESGRCKDAEPYLRASVGYWSFAKDALAKPCNDVPSGLQFCFETHDYCRASTQ